MEKEKPSGWDKRKARQRMGNDFQLISESLHGAGCGVLADLPIKIVAGEAFMYLISFFI